MQALTWDNPFNPVVPAPRRASWHWRQTTIPPAHRLDRLRDHARRCAPAPTSPWAHTQNAASCRRLNPVWRRGAVAAAQSLDGQVDTFNATSLTAAPPDDLRLNASYARDERDNDTAVQAYPNVATDVRGPEPRSNTPYGLTQDRFKLNADFRGPGTWRLTGGIDWESRDRNYTAGRDDERDDGVGARRVQPIESLGCP